MSEPQSIDDRLKQASLDKALAEIEKLRSETFAAGRAAEKSRAEAIKLRCEARSLGASKRGERFTEPLKLFGAVILGIGGAVAAWTQYEVAELKAKAAEQEKSQAEKLRDEARIASEVALKKQANAERKASEAASLAASAVDRFKTAEKAVVDLNVKAAESRRDAVSAQFAVAAAKAEYARLSKDVARLDAELGQSKAKLAAANANATEAQSSLEKGVLDGLQPSARDLAVKLLKTARERGYPLTLVAGYRSPAQQLALYAKGRTEPGAVVTMARVSVHNTGLAFDVAFKKGDTVTWDDIAAFNSVGAIGEELGLVWGKALDSPHFETKDARDALTKLLANEKS